MVRVFEYDIGLLCITLFQFKCFLELNQFFLKPYGCAFRFCDINVLFFYVNIKYNPYTKSRNAFGVLSAVYVSV